MSEVYVVLNGDNVGDELGDNIVNDNVQGFQESSNKFNQARGKLDQLAQQQGGKVIVSNGDESVYCLPQESAESFAQAAMQSFESDSGKTLTVGIGSSLREGLTVSAGTSPRRILQ